MHPKIGIIICGFNENRQFVPNVYIQSVRYAKGIPLLIPLVRSDRMIDDYVSLCDGFIFCGGEDITPLLFGEEPQNGNGKTDITVDLFQIRLMKRVLASRKPVLAICRGMQILNVSCGGTIWQDLSLIPQPTLNHTQQSASRGDVSHRIKIERCSKLKQFVGSCIYVNSFHPGETSVSAPVPRTASLRQSNFPDILSPSEFNGIPSACIAPRLKCVLFSMNLLHIHL